MRWTRPCWITSCGGPDNREGGRSMAFVQASMLAALGAVTLPILAHLLFRRRSRPVDLGTLRFLKVAVRQDTRRRWLKRWLLLALRLGCVVLLVLLFARPFRAEFTGS